MVLRRGLEPCLPAGRLEKDPEPTCAVIMPNDEVVSVRRSKTLRGQVP